MPKILINEKDRTSPGTPGSYANYSVLIAGYQVEFTESELTAAEAEITAAEAAIANGEKAAPLSTTALMIKARKERVDSNGVYEFNSKQAFEDTIGRTDAEKTIKVKDDNGEEIEKTEYHCGNRMAYELLNLGYTVIYKPIEKIADMNTETFWELFKDKASYDFRFVSHGLLKTSYDKTAYDALVARLAVIEKDIDEFATVTADTYDSYIEKCQNGGTTAEGDTLWFTDNTSLIQYGSYADAKERLTANTEGIIPNKAEQELLIEKFNRISVSPAVFNNINSHITKLARYVENDPAAIPGRGDCVALIELDENCYATTASSRPENLIIEGINNMSASIADDGTYCTLTVPSVNYKMSGEVVKFPGAFHYLACFMNSLRAGFAEWYAAAGYTRGVSSYMIDHTTVKLGEIAINALEPRNIVDDPAKVQPAFACNVIANFRGSYYLWGNRTAHKLGSAAGGNDLVAHHFLNIRQLCTTIKKQLYVACRRFTFDPNSDTLWFNFVNAITPTLDVMKADQGVRDYKILKVFTDKKATLKAKIRIIPIEAVEDFDLEVSLEDSFGETSAVVTE